MTNRLRLLSRLPSKVFHMGNTSGQRRTPTAERVVRDEDSINNTHKASSTTRAQEVEITSIQPLKFLPANTLASFTV